MKHALSSTHALPATGAFARGDGAPEVDTVLSAQALFTAVKHEDPYQVRSLMVRSAQASDPMLVARNAKVAWGAAQSLLREQDEPRALALMTAMPESFVQAEGGSHKDDALALAAQLGLRQTSATLLSWGANPAAKDAQQMTPLMHLACNGDHQMLDVALRLLDQRRFGLALHAMNEVDRNGWLLSMHAVVSAAPDTDRLATLDVLRKFGHELGRPQDKDGYNELHMAAGLGDVVMVKHLLGEHHLDPNALSRKQVTPVMAACHANEPATIPVLAFHGADLDRRSEHNGQSAAHIAAHRGNTECLKALYDNGADLHVPALDTGYTAAQSARFIGQGKTARYIEQLQPAPSHPMAAIASQTLAHLAQRINEAIEPIRETVRKLAPGG